MTIRVEITADTPAELLAQIASLATVYGVTSGADEAASSAGEPQQRRRRTKAEIEAAKAAESAGTSTSQGATEAPKTSTSETAQLKRDVAGVAQVVEPEDDGLGEDDGLEEAPQVTRDDVRALLLELKNLARDDSKLIVNHVNSIAGVPKLADVAEDKLPALFAATKKKLAEMKK